MTDLERLQAWLRTCPQAGSFRDWKVDYTDQLPGIFGTFPAGMQEVSRKRDILDNVTVTNRYNFSIYAVLPKPTGDDVAAEFNAGWVMEFQRWVQEQSLRHKAPTFGNVDANRETIRAQDGALYEVAGKGLAMYSVQLSVEFKKYYEEGDAS